MDSKICPSPESLTQAEARTIPKDKERYHSATRFRSPLKVNTSVQPSLQVKHGQRVNRSSTPSPVRKPIPTAISVKPSLRGGTQLALKTQIKTFSSVRNSENKNPKLSVDTTIRSRSNKNSQSRVTNLVSQNRSQSARLAIQRTQPSSKTKPPNRGNQSLNLKGQEKKITAAAQLASSYRLANSKSKRANLPILLANKTRPGSRFSTYIETKRPETPIFKTGVKNQVDTQDGSELLMRRIPRKRPSLSIDTFKPAHKLNNEAESKSTSTPLVPVPSESEFQHTTCPINSHSDSPNSQGSKNQILEERTRLNNLLNIVDQYQMENTNITNSHFEMDRPSSTDVGNLPDANAECEMCAQSSGPKISINQFEPWTSGKDMYKRHTFSFSDATDDVLYNKHSGFANQTSMTTWQRIPSKNAKNMLVFYQHLEQILLYCVHSWCMKQNLFGLDDSLREWTEIPFDTDTLLQACFPNTLPTLEQENDLQVFLLSLDFLFPARKMRKNQEKKNFEVRRLGSVFNIKRMPQHISFSVPPMVRGELYEFTPCIHAPQFAAGEDQGSMACMEVVWKTNIIPWLKYDTESGAFRGIVPNMETRCPSISLDLAPWKAVQLKSYRFRSSLRAEIIYRFPNTTYRLLQILCGVIEAPVLPSKPSFRADEGLRPYHSIGHLQTQDDLCSQPIPWYDMPQNKRGVKALKHSHMSCPMARPITPELPLNQGTNVVQPWSLFSTPLIDSQKTPQMVEQSPTLRKYLKRLSQHASMSRQNITRTPDVGLSSSLILPPPKTFEDPHVYTPTSKAAQCDLDLSGQSSTSRVSRGNEIEHPEYHELNEDEISTKVREFFGKLPYPKASNAGKSSIAVTFCNPDLVESEFSERILSRASQCINIKHQAAMIEWYLSEYEPMIESKEQDSKSKPEFGAEDDPEAEDDSDEELYRFPEKVKATSLNSEYRADTCTSQTYQTDTALYSPTNIDTLENNTVENTVESDTVENNIVENDTVENDMESNSETDSDSDSDSSDIGQAQCSGEDSDDDSETEPTIKGPSLDPLHYHVCVYNPTNRPYQYTSPNAAAKGYINIAESDDESDDGLDDDSKSNVSNITQAPSSRENSVNEDSDDDNADEVLEQEFEHQVKGFHEASTSASEQVPMYPHIVPDHAAEMEPFARIKSMPEEKIPYDADDEISNDESENEEDIFGFKMQVETSDRSSSEKEDHTKANIPLASEQYSAHQEPASNDNTTIVIESMDSDVEAALRACEANLETTDIFEMDDIEVEPETTLIDSTTTDMPGLSSISNTQIIEIGFVRKDTSLHRGQQRYLFNSSPVNRQAVCEAIHEDVEYMEEYINKSETNTEHIEYMEDHIIDPEANTEHNHTSNSEQTTQKELFITSISEQFNDIDFNEDCASPWLAITLRDDDFVPSEIEPLDGFVGISTDEMRQFANYRS